MSAPSLCTPMDSSCTFSGPGRLRADVPIVWHVHEYVSPRPITRTLLKRHVSRAAAIVANSHSVAADLSRVLGAHAPVSTIYNAVDLQEFSPDGATCRFGSACGSHARSRRHARWPRWRRSGAGRAMRRFSAPCSARRAAEACTRLRHRRAALRHGRKSVRDGRNPRPRP